jgi:HrpA-like RNA helicase
VYVIDSGMLKEMEYYPETCMQSLTTKWISLSNFRQRRGRAGRVRSGYYFSLISETLLPYLLEFQTPEIVRSDLMGLCLKAKALHVSNVIDFIKKCIQPPDIHLVNGCLHRLKRLQAFDEREELTPLGWQLSKLPLSPTLGKALIYACFFRCIDPILTIIASMTLRDPFDISPDSKKEVSNSRFLFGQAQRSDHLTLFFLFNQWQSTLLPDSLIQEHDFINKHCLSKSTLSQISELRYYLYNALADAGLVDKYHFTRTSNELIGGPRFNENSSDLNLLKGLLVIAMYPNVSYRVGRKMFKTKHDLRIKIHPSSVVYRDAAGVQSLFYMFQGKVKTSEPFLRQVTCVSVYALLIFGGESLRWYYDPIIDQKKGNFDERNYSQATHCSIYDNDSYGVCVLDEWIYLACKKSLFENLYNLRQHFEWILFQRLRHLYWDWEKSIGFFLLVISIFILNICFCRVPKFNELHFKISKFTTAI